MSSSDDLESDDSALVPIIGWVANNNYHADEHDVVEYCTRLGCFSYNFILYPVGGVARDSWQPQKLVQRVFKRCFEKISCFR